jgi:hypothetical protein
VERIDASAQGRVEVAGRWFGVRGRRFVRPTLTLSHRGAAVRALAELEHKPWAAEDGEVWIAAFSLDKGLDAAREIELSVAPDIVVGLRPKGKKLAKPGDTLAAGAAARSPRFKRDAAPAPAQAQAQAQAAEADTSPPATRSGESPATRSGSSSATPSGEPSAEPAPTLRRRSSPSAELQRLGARLASANHALEQERERRAALGKTLEEERSVSRQLRTELGQARVELEVAAAARAEAAAMEEALDATRRELREAQRQHEEVTDELTRRHTKETQDLSSRHDEVTQAHAALQDAHHEHSGALESTREALAAERAESARLRTRLTQAQEARQRGAVPTGAPAAPAAPAGEPREPRTSRTSRASRRATSRTAAELREPDPSETQRFDVRGLDDELDTVTSPPPPSRPAPRRSGNQTLEDPNWNPPTADRLRPLNPSLRHRTWWFGRLLALIVLCGVIAAVWMVLHSTVLH